MLTAGDKAQIMGHWRAIISILERAGCDHAKMYEFLNGLLNNWWIDAVCHSVTAPAKILGLFNVW